MCMSHEQSFSHMFQNMLCNYSRINVNNCKGLIHIIQEEVTRYTQDINAQFEESFKK
jgi:hypothetical protein